MMILYKNDRNVRFVLFTKTLNVLLVFLLFSGNDQKIHNIPKLLQFRDSSCYFPDYDIYRASNRQEIMQLCKDPTKTETSLR